MSYRSQVGQDRWVLSVLGTMPESGYFVELGAADGFTHSNTYHMERELGWDGICIEPHPRLLKKLRRRRRCHICDALVSGREGLDLVFQLDDELSGIRGQAAGGMMADDKRLPTVTRRSTTLAAVLARFDAPDVIDYLSLDVEGHELEILASVPFERYTFLCMTVEHNAPHQGPAMQQQIRVLLEAEGYRYVKGNDDVLGWGHGPIDDFYVHSST